MVVRHSSLILPGSSFSLYGAMYKFSLVYTSPYKSLKLSIFYLNAERSNLAVTLIPASPECIQLAAFRSFGDLISGIMIAFPNEHQRHSGPATPQH
jgi:hypothetical protein